MPWTHVINSGWGTNQIPTIWFLKWCILKVSAAFWFPKHTVEEIHVICLFGSWQGYANFLTHNVKLDYGQIQLHFRSLQTFHTIFCSPHLCSFCVLLGSPSSLLCSELLAGVCDLFFNCLPPFISFPFYSFQCVFYSCWLWCHCSLLYLFLSLSLNIALLTVSHVSDTGATHTHTCTPPHCDR